MKADLQALYDRGYRSLAIVLVHSYTYPEHEKLVGKIARQVGFTHVSESSALLPMIKVSHVGLQNGTRLMLSVDGPSWRVKYC